MTTTNALEPFSVAGSTKLRERPLDIWRGLVQLAPGFLFLVIFMVLPLGITVLYSLQPNILLQPESHSPLANYVYVMKQGVYLDAFLRTFRLSIYVVLASFLLGYPTAVLLRRVRARLASTLILGLSFPILAGPLVVVLGWMLLLPKGGPINSLLVSAGLLSQPIQFIGTDMAVIIAMVQFTLAFVVLNIYNSLTQIDPAIVEAANSLGAGPLRAFWYVTWPLSLPGVLSGTLVAFSLAISAFVAPYYLGGATRLVATTLIGQFILAAFNWELASATAVLLVVMAFVLIYGYNKAVVRVIERRFGLYG
jgi:putative spermidine/putrescine transport system permease protein